jgi:beta-lactam-binding protein with PASTA domain
VLATSPPIAANLAPASPVSLLVNVAPARELWVMPSLLSRSESVVRRFCQDHQLRLGQVHEVDYPGVPGQVVLRQYPAAGSPLARTDIITIWVSR